MIYFARISASHSSCNTNGEGGIKTLAPLSPGPGGAFARNKLKLNRESPLGFTDTRALIDCGADVSKMITGDLFVGTPSEFGALGAGSRAASVLLNIGRAGERGSSVSKLNHFESLRGLSRPRGRGRGSRSLGRLGRVTASASPKDFPAFSPPEIFRGAGGIKSLGPLAAVTARVARAQKLFSRRALKKSNRNQNNQTDTTCARAIVEAGPHGVSNLPHLWGGTARVAPRTYPRNSTNVFGKIGGIGGGRCSAMRISSAA
jgi:hypothetical protein